MLKLKKSAWKDINFIWNSKTIIFLIDLRNFQAFQMIMLIFKIYFFLDTERKKNFWPHKRCICMIFAVDRFFLTSPDEKPEWVIEGPLAQRLEQGTHNSLVIGSNPVRPTIFFMSKEKKASHPISKYIGKFRKGYWVFVKDFEGTYDETLKEISNLCLADREAGREEGQYRIWDDRWVSLDFSMGRSHNWLSWWRACSSMVRASGI